MIVTYTVWVAWQTLPMYISDDALFKNKKQKQSMLKLISVS